MASITTRKNGSRFIGFVDGDGNRQTITLGKASQRHAESLKVKVEDLVWASISGHAPQRETSLWLAERDDKILAKLARVGLVQARQQATLRGWLDQYLKEREADLKPASMRKLEQTKAKLLHHFDEALQLRKITTGQAAEWRQWLRAQGLSEAAIKTHCGNVKTIMAEAARRRLIDADPFQHLKGGATASRYSRYVTPDEIGQLINACPTAEWKLLFGLARYAGLRVPSESHLLTWADVDWEKSRLLVRSPKTEHHDGHDQRTVPIVPALMKLLNERFDECPEGEHHLISLNLTGAARRKIGRYFRKAKVERWKRLWQTLRQSCEKEWAMRFPQYAVSKWIGHSITVSGKHYANAVPDELFDKAATLDSEKAQRKAQQKVQESTRNESKSEQGELVGCAATSGNARDFRESSDSVMSNSKGERGDSNPRLGRR